jgi:hypothetical protein
MKRCSKVVLFGFLVWLIPFIVSFAVFPLKKSMNPLFETIMAVVVTLVGVIFVYLYFKKVELNFFKEGILFGLVLFVMSIVIDLLLFMWGPMKITFGNYMMDIGLTYLIYPIVSGGFGLLLEYKNSSLCK